MIKVSVENVDPVRRRLSIEVPESAVAADTEKAYAELRQRARVPGFRPGRAPRAVLERLFGGQVRADVFAKLVQSSFVDALREQQIDPVGQPEIVTEQAEPGQPLRYSATVEVKPTLEIKDYAGLDAERPLRPVNEEDVDRFLEELRQSFAQLLPIEGRTEARPGDVATIDADTRIGARNLRRLDNRLVEVRAGAEGGDLAARLDGMEVGSTSTFDVQYPPDHPDSNVAGQSVTFQLQLKALSRREVPVLDDEFAKDHGECDTLGELRERVHRHLEASAARDADRAVRANLMQQLVRSNPVEVPRAMVDRRTEAMVENFFHELGTQRPPASREEEVRARLRAELEPRAREQVLGALILEAVAQQERLEISEADLQSYIDQVAEQAQGASSERIRALYQDPSRRDALRADLLQERALDLIVGRAHLRDVEAKSDVAAAEGTG